MRCRCCNSPEAVWDGVDYYCEECLEEIRETIRDYEDEDDTEDYTGYLDD